MPKQNSAKRIARDQVKDKRMKSSLQRTSSQPVTSKQQVHPASIFPKGRINRVTDERFGLFSRQTSAQHLGATIGNRKLQQLLIRSDIAGSTLIQRDTVQRGIVNWFKKILGSDPEGAVRNMDSKLDRASKLLDVAASTAAGKPDLRKKLEAAKEGIDNLKSASSGVVKVLDARDKVRKVWSFVSALESVPDNIASDPEKAAQAFGKVFSTAGELGEMLPNGPWTPYFKFLQRMGSFFSDMLYGLDPYKKPSNRKYREFLPK